MTKVDKSSLIAMIFIAILDVRTYFFQNEVMKFLRLILEKGYLKSNSMVLNGGYILIIIVAVIIISHSLKVKPNNDSSNVMIRSVGIFLTLSTYVAVTTTACSLLESAFLIKIFWKSFSLPFYARNI